MYYQDGTLYQRSLVLQVTVLKIHKIVYISWIIYKVQVLFWYMKQNSLWQDVICQKYLKRDLKIVLIHSFILKESVTATANEQQS